MPDAHLHPLLVLAVTLAGAAVMVAWRVRETTTPVTIRKIVIPPLGMSTGLAMFAFPVFRVPWSWAAIAFAVGAAVLAWPLARTSQLVRSGDAVVMRRSRAFLWILLGLVAVRYGARAYVEQFMTTPQTGGVFFLLAFGAIVRWRVAMLLAYLKLRDPPEDGAAVAAS
jgi:membrane protein CcdC involved in cytochrome C biogenesis